MDHIANHIPVDLTLGVSEVHLLGEFRVESK